MGPKLGHRSQSAQRAAPGDGEPKAWPMPACPTEHGWSEVAVDWWRLAVGSPSAAQAWTDFERAKVYRVLVMVDAWSRMAVASPGEAARLSEVIRRAEEELYLSPKARAQAGIVADDTASRASHPSGGGARARTLRAVGGPDAVGS